MREAHPDYELNFDFEPSKTRDLKVTVEHGTQSSVLFSRAVTGGYPQKDLTLFNQTFRDAITDGQ